MPIYTVPDNFIKIKIYFWELFVLTFILYVLASLNFYPKA